MSVQRRNLFITLAAVLAVAIVAVLIIVFMNNSGDPEAQNPEEAEFATNPIIWADVPDPSVIRVGDEYYMSSTTMHMMPGTPIMRSTDLVNWEIVGYPYDRLEENDIYALRNGQDAYGRGSWASSLNYHDGKFYVLFSALDSGKTYLFSTRDPAGKWSRTEFFTYMHDPSLLFDDDGKAYIIHGRTNLQITELSPDLKSINLTGLNKTIIETDKEGMEGAHAYKIDGRYYITTIWWEPGDKRKQYVYRADKIDGPYEGRLVLDDNMGYKNNGVAQGGLVDTPDGEWYAMLFQDHDAVGRIPVLVPVRWEDGWPVYGDENGKVPLTFKKPGTSDFVTNLVRSDEFYQEDIIEREVDPALDDEQGAQLTKNFNFEEGMAPWKARDAEVELIREDSNDIAHVKNRKSTSSGIEQSFSWRLQRGNEYIAAFRIKYTEGPDEKEFILTAEKTKDNQTTYQNLVRGVAKKGEWTLIQGSFTLPDDPSSINLFLETPWADSPDPEKDLMDFYVDYVSVRENISFVANPEAAFNGSVLGLTWQWNHNPDNTKWSLTERKGYLRLRTANIAENIERARNTLTQRTQGPYSSGWISMDISRMLDGDYAGLAAFQKEYGFIGVTKQDGKNYLVMVDKGQEKERQLLDQDTIHLKIDMDFNVDRAKFYYSYDGGDWIQFGTELTMRYTLPHFMGYRFAIFNYATKQLGGYVDVDYFRFSPELTADVTPAAFVASLPTSEIIVSAEPEEMTYDIPVAINRVPEGQVTNVTFTVNIPEELDIVGVEPFTENMSGAKIDVQKVAGGAEITITPEDGNAIKFAQKDGTRRIATMTFKVTKQLDNDYTGEVSLKEMSIQNGESNSYDVSGASAKLSRPKLNEALGKLPNNGNPLISHKFGADPYALVYDGRVYIYMTNDTLEYDANGNIKDNSYSSINKIGVISSDDLVNWTDHGEIHVAGRDGAAKWATQSWAPAIAHKVIDGKDKFFLYFANNASNIGVLVADSPIGPWEDPIGKPLITHQTPGVRGVHWLFDPAVLVDDDGKAYIYFGGGYPEGQHENPKTSRVMQLGDDMISVVGEAVEIDAPYMFENNGIHKYNGVYYYTYCSNFHSGPRAPGMPGGGEIAYMTSDNPMGPWKYEGTILSNPHRFFGVGGNNHHAVFEFNDKWYITYHAQTLGKAMGIERGYRSTHLNEVLYNEDGTIIDIIGTYEGVPQIREFNPFERVEAETFAWNAGVKSRLLDENDPSQRALTDIHNGDWVALSKVDFGDGAATFTAAVGNVKADGFIELRIGGLDGELIGTLPVRSGELQDGWTELSTSVKPVQGVHDLYMIFAGTPDTELFEVDYWTFDK